MRTFTALYADQFHRVIKRLVEMPWELKALAVAAEFSVWYLVWKRYRS